MTASQTPLRYECLDVFAPHAYRGSSLPVFTNASNLDGEQMLAVAQELRQFETIFLVPSSAKNRFRARIFDLLEELPFAGHPLLGAAAALHHIAAPPKATCQWTFELANRCVDVSTYRTGHGFAATVDQGAASVVGECARRSELAAAFGLRESDLDPALPLEVISTGLAYLIVPVRSDALGRARIDADITELLTPLGANFAVLLDEEGREARHWNNDGRLEDVATGSAAGTIGAYRLRHCGSKSGETFILNQGRFVGRPSRMEVVAHGAADAIHSVQVGGPVSVVGWGMLEVLPQARMSSQRKLNHAAS
ncbi:PhzF family phenazine biosynthesis protein [Devosia oryziradicis]|uniref:PhzF family phenazine biosynthesis protein n=1 Tax=Devosia oryziradicis TaxID=2801335 RepID=A0ABX7BTZ2_9HYPH|nr:PhzF family phenazine biosynthesis protein [Devosia oryziradicis]QQR34494.1 PhzF family phenazine biosynthesis protein [Devosia oryziradicis]